MINISINNESLYKAAQELGHHYSAEETIENALKVYISHLQSQPISSKASKLTHKKTRTFGQHKGLIKVSDDFDNSLADSFWLGDDE